jgi:hypothetical protein
VAAHILFSTAGAVLRGGVARLWSDEPIEADHRDLTTVNWLPEVREQLNRDIEHAQRLMRDLALLSASGAESLSPEERRARGLPERSREDIRRELDDLAETLRELWDLREEPELLDDAG